MQKSYIAKVTIDLIDSKFYIRPGDLLVHDTANHNRLTVYRNGQIVKVAKQEPIGMNAFLRNRFIEEVLTDGVEPPPSAPVAPPEPRKGVKKAGVVPDSPKDDTED